MAAPAMAQDVYFFLNDAKEYESTSNVESVKFSDMHDWASANSSNAWGQHWRYQVKNGTDAIGTKLSDKMTGNKGAGARSFSAIVSYE